MKYSSYILFLIYPWNSGNPERSLARAVFRSGVERPAGSGCISPLPPSGGEELESGVVLDIGVRQLPRGCRRASGVKQEKAVGLDLRREPLSKCRDNCRLTPSCGEELEKR